MEMHTSPSSELPPTGGKPASALRDNLAPLARQTWLNLRVWTPFLLNPRDRARQVVYWARESQERDVWMITLPAQCWYCRRRDGLQDYRFDRTVRSFDYPQTIVGMTAFVTAGVWLLALLMWSWKLLIFGALVVLFGICMVILKSWEEQVRVVISSCPDHADEVECPEVASDQGELYLYAPTAELADAAREELKAARRRAKEHLSSGNTEGRSISGGSIPMDDAPAASQHRQPAGPKNREDRWQPSFEPPQPTDDLPPIKLAGEEDEESAGG